MSESEFLTRRQRLERRKMELYASDALVNRSSLLHKSAKEELEQIQRELLSNTEKED